jgi:aminopeptidase-like protein
MQQDESQVGQKMHDLARALFPICRSLTGNGVRKTLQILQQYLPELDIHEVPSGAHAFDWTVPSEWNIDDAYLLGPDGHKVVDFQQNNLHVVGYSEPVDKEMSLAVLQQHLYSLPEQPSAIPYITSYYERRWGFCLSHHEREALKDGTYRAVIDSALVPGALTYADLIIPGETAKEVLLSTYICHPSLGNNELSGPVVATFLARWLKAIPHRRFTYRFVFIPETIGSIVYISRNLEALKSLVVAGFNITCVGDDRAYSYVPTRNGNTWSDKVALHVLKHVAKSFNEYTFLDRGGDERQYCAPGIDLPIASVMRSKYGTYPEYHTSLDDLSLITPEGLAGGFVALRRCLEVLEIDRSYVARQLCEPQMGRRGLYSTLGTTLVSEAVKNRMNILAYCDGHHSVLAVAEKLGRPAWELGPYFEELVEHGLIEEAIKIELK